MDDRLKIGELIAKLGAEDRLNRVKQDRVPISPEEDYILNQIASQHEITDRAKTWRWLLAKYSELRLAEEIVATLKEKQRAEATLTTLLEHR